MPAFLLANEISTALHPRAVPLVESCLDFEILNQVVNVEKNEAKLQLFRLCPNTSNDVAL
jgi:hypothetical protein